MDVDIKYVILLLYSKNALLYNLRYALLNACNLYGTMKVFRLNVRRFSVCPESDG